MIICEKYPEIANGSVVLHAARIIVIDLPLNQFSIGLQNKNSLVYTY